MKLRELLDNFPWGEDVEFHSIGESTLCATFVSDAEEICVDGDKIYVQIETPEGMAPPPEWLYEVSRMRFFVEYVVGMRRKQYPDNENYLSDVEIAQYFIDQTNQMMAILNPVKDDESE